MADGAYETNANHPASVRWPYIEAKHDTGIFVRSLILDVPAGKNLYAYRALITISEFLEIWGRINSVPVRFREISFDEMVIRSGPLGIEGAETFAYKEDFGYEAWDDPTVVHPEHVSYLYVLLLLTNHTDKYQLGVHIVLPTVEDWIRKQDWSSVIKA